MYKGEKNSRKIGLSFVGLIKRKVWIDYMNRLDFYIVCLKLLIEYLYTLLKNIDCHRSLLLLAPTGVSKGLQTIFKRWLSFFQAVMSFQAVFFSNTIALNLNSKVIQSEPKIFRLVLVKKKGANLIYCITVKSKAPT